MPPEERARVHLLYGLYACVFWRGEAEHLANVLASRPFDPTARNELAGGFFIFRHKSSGNECEKEINNV